MAVAATGAVVAVVGAISDFLGQRGQARIQNAQNYATKITNEANNQYQVSASALQNYIRTQQNNRILMAAGENYNTLGQNITRILDDSVRGRTAQRLQATEQIAQMSVMAAASGVGGSTTEMLNSTYRRAVEFSEQFSRESIKYAIRDMDQQRMNQISNAVASMDQGTSFAQLGHVVTSEQRVNPFGHIVRGIQGALPYIDTMMQNRAANKTDTTKTTSAPKTNNITLL